MKLDLKLDLNNTCYLNNIESKEEFKNLIDLMCIRLDNLLSKMNEEEIIEIDNNYYLEFDEEEKNILFDTIDLIELIKKEMN